MDPRRQGAKNRIVLAGPRRTAAREQLGGALVKAAVARARRRDASASRYVPRPTTAWRAE